MPDHGAQVLEVEQQKAVVVGNLEHQLQHTGLRFVEIQQAREQDRPHVRDRRPDRVTLLAGHIPEGRRESGGCPVVDAEHFQALPQFRALTGRCGQSGKIPFHVGEKDRHTDGRKAFGHHLQGNGLAGAGRPGNQAVAIGQRGQKGKVGGFMAGNK